MSDNVKHLVELANHMNGQSFPVGDYYQRKYQTVPSYCAAFVRYAFDRALGIKLPVIPRPPYYQKAGIPYTGGFYTADGLAGEAVGPVVAPKLMQPGDLTFFKDTCRGFVPGTITHVGFCVSSSGMIADCGGGPTTHVRNHNAVFPGLLVEVRRPICLAREPADRSSVKLEGGHLEVMAHGKKVSALELDINYNQLLHVKVNGKETKCDFVTVEITCPNPANNAKLFYHDKQVHALHGGGQVGKLEVRATVSGGLHLFLNQKEIKPIRVNIEVVRNLPA